MCFMMCYWIRKTTIWTDTLSLILSSLFCRTWNALSWSKNRVANKCVACYLHPVSSFESSVFAASVNDGSCFTGKNVYVADCITRNLPCRLLPNVHLHSWLQPKIPDSTLLFSDSFSALAKYSGHSSGTNEASSFMFGHVYPFRRSLFTSLLFLFWCLKTAPAH